jgi:DNA-binding XRE family transcriptional regulator
MTALHATTDLGRLLKTLGLDAEDASSPIDLARSIAALTDAKWKQLVAARHDHPADIAAPSSLPAPIVQLFSLGGQMWAAVETARDGYRSARGKVAAELRELHLSTIAFALTPPSEHRAGKRSHMSPSVPADEAAVRADREALAAACRRLRGERQLTQDQLAERAQVSHVTINALEKGATRPHAKTLAKIAAALGVPSLTLMRAG